MLKQSSLCCGTVRGSSSGPVFLFFNWVWSQNPWFSIRSVRCELSVRRLATEGWACLGNRLQRVLRRESGLVRRVWRETGLVRRPAPHQAGKPPKSPHKERFLTKPATPSRISADRPSPSRIPAESPTLNRNLAGPARRERVCARRRLQKWQLFRGSCSFLGTLFTGPGGRHP